MNRSYVIGAPFRCTEVIGNFLPPSLVQAIDQKGNFDLAHDLASVTKTPSTSQNSKFSKSFSRRPLSLFNLEFEFIFRIT